MLSLAMYAGSGLSVLRGFRPTLFGVASAKNPLWLRLLAVGLSVTATVTVGCIGLLSAMDPLVRGIPATGADLWVGRIFFGAGAVAMFGFAAWTLVRAAMMVRNHDTDSRAD